MTTPARVRGSDTGRQLQDDEPLGSNPLGRRFLHGATSRILLSWAILFDAATLLSVFEPGEKNDDDIE